MKIGVLSDIHGNDVGLEAVLSDASSMGVEHLFILGDLVGYYYNIDKVLMQLKNWSYDLIGGNHEWLMKKSMTDMDYLEKVTKKYGSGIKIAIRKLTSEQLRYLCDLPEYRVVSKDDIEFGLYHGSPRSLNEYVYPDAGINVLQEISCVGHDYILMGHTHYPMCTCINNVILINPGSVGQPRDISGLASWAMVDTRNKVVVQRRVKFPTSGLIKLCRKNDPSLLYLQNVLVRDVK